MNKLTKKAFEAAGQFILSKGRSLERARYDHAFGSGPPEAILQSLARFQNGDGGFGHALEPDLRAPESSALCTTIAFQVLRELGTSATRPWMSRGVGFFVRTFVEARQTWRIIPEVAGESPSAPWWCQTERMDRFDEFSLNPTAEILGYLFDWHQQVPLNMVSHVKMRVFAELASINGIEMHSLLCCLRLLQTESLPVGCRKQLMARLRPLVSNAVVREPEAWKGYCLRPLQVIDDPGSPFMQGLEDAVAANLDYEVSSQNADGSWSPTWSWDDAYPDEWSNARNEWSGILTIEKLLILRRFGRIDGIA